MWQVVVGIATVVGGIAAVIQVMGARTSRSSLFKSNDPERLSEGDRSIARSGSAPNAPSKVTATPATTPRDGVELDEGDSSRGKILPLQDEVLSMADVVDALASKTMTDLQKSRFAERHSERRVVWTGIVVSVKKTWESEADSPITVIVVPPDREARGSDILVTEFPHEHVAELTPLHRDDKVVIEGTLHFTNLGLGRLAVLRDCRLIRVVA